LKELFHSREKSKRNNSDLYFLEEHMKRSPIVISGSESFLVHPRIA
jgi:hypothetical protein